MSKSNSFTLLNPLSTVFRGYHHVVVLAKEAVHDEDGVVDAVRSDVGPATRDILSNVQSPGAYMTLPPFSFVESMRSAERIDPLATDDALFRNFADLGYDQDAILRFADTYGALGQACDLEIEDSDWIALIGERDVNTLGADGEPLALWHWAIWNMRVAIAIADAIQTGAWDAVIKLGDTTADILVPAPDGYGWVEKFGHIEMDDGFADAAEVGKFMLTYIVDEFVSGRVAVSLCGNGIQTTQSPNGFSVAMRNDSLMSAMFSQFVAALADGGRFQRCEHCGRWFRLSGGRSDRTTCSAKCRTAAWRKRKE